MIKRPRISKEELIADGIFFLVAMIISAIAIFIFDIHWSFYPGNEIFPPNKRIFTGFDPYIVGIPIGGIIGFIILKLLAFAFLEEEKEYHNNHVGKNIKHKRR